MRKRFGKVKIFTAAMLLAMSMVCGCSKKDDDNANGSDGNKQENQQDVNQGANDGNASTQGIRTVAIKDSDYAIKNHPLNGTNAIYEINISPWMKSEYPYISCIRPYNENYLMCIFEDTQLVILNPLDGSVVAQKQLPDGYFYDDCVFIDENGNLAFLNYMDSKIYFYDSSLTQYDCIDVSQLQVSIGYLNKDFTEMYYTNYEDTNLHRYNFKTKQDESITITDKQAVFMNICGYSQSENCIMLELYSGDWENGEDEMIVWDLTTNQKKDIDVGMINSFKDNENYYVADSYVDGMYTCYFGDKSSGNTHIYRFDETALDCYPSFDLEHHMAVTSIEQVANAGESREEFIALHDLEKGKIAETSFQAGDKYVYIGKSVYLPEAQLVVFSYEANNTVKLCVWDLVDDTNNTSFDETYLFSVDCAKGTDAAFSQELEETKKEIENKYNVEIHYDDSISSCEITDYTYEKVNSQFSIDRTLKILNRELAKYPEGMIEQLGEKVQFYIVNKMEGNSQNAVEFPSGAQHTISGKPQILLNVDNAYELDKTIHHEIFHAFEDYLVSVGSEFDDDTWCALNPSDFSYSYSYQEIGYDDISYIDENYGQEGEGMMDYPEDYTYYDGCEEDKAYFVDYYSQKFPNEDRASVFAAAMTENSYGMHYFNASHIREKLRAIDEKLRNGFNTENWPEQTEWEAWMTEK